MAVNADVLAETRWRRVVSKIVGARRNPHESCRRRAAPKPSGQSSRSMQKQEEKRNYTQTATARCRGPATRSLHLLMRKLLPKTKKWRRVVSRLLAAKKKRMNTETAGGAEPSHPSAINIPPDSSSERRNKSSLDFLLQTKSCSVCSMYVPITVAFPCTTSCTVRSKFAVARQTTGSRSSCCSLVMVWVVVMVCRVL